MRDDRERGGRISPALGIAPGANNQNKFRTMKRFGAGGLAGALLSRDLAEIRQFCDESVPGLLPPHNSESYALASLRLPLSLEHFIKAMHVLLIFDAQSGHPEPVRARIGAHLLSLLAQTQIEDIHPDHVASVAEAMRAAPGAAFVSWLQTAHVTMIKRIVVRVLPLWQGLEEAAPLAARIDLAQGVAAAAKIGLDSTTSGSIAATALKLMEIGTQRTLKGTTDGPTLADSPWEEHFLKLSIIARVCHPERDAAKVGFVDRPGSFPYCDIVNPALLPKIMASAPLMSAASLERMRQDFASGTSRLESSSDSALGTLAFQRDNSRILINELPEQYAQYSKPTAALLADITSSGRTWWFCCAEEWRRAGPKTSLDGHGDLIFIGINAEFLLKLQACAVRLALQEPITPPSTPLPHAPPQLSFRNAGTFSGLLPDSATAEGTTGAATQGRDGRTGSLGGGSMTDEANMAGSEEGIVVLDEASAARPSSAGSASSAVDGTGRSVVEHRAMLNRLSINSNLAGGGPGIGLKTALTTWSFFPLPMTPVHASVVEELAVAMAGLLPIQEVESKYLNFLAKHATATPKRLKHLEKLASQAAEYGTLLRREFAQDPLLGPMNACQIYPFTAINTSSVNMDCVDIRLSGFAPECDLWNQRLKFIFGEFYLDWAMACLRHSLCLGGWASPLPRTPPTRGDEIAPGMNGIMWAPDGAPVRVVAPPPGSPPPVLPENAMAWARIGGCTGATSAPDSGGGAIAPAEGSGLTHNFKPNYKAERMGLTQTDYTTYMAMLPPNLKLRQRKRLKLIHSLKAVHMRGGDPLALVKQMFPHGGSRELVEAGKKQLPSSMGAGLSAADRGCADDDDEEDD